LPNHSVEFIFLAAVSRPILLRAYVVAFKMGIAVPSRPCSPGPPTMRIALSALLTVVFTNVRNTATRWLEFTLIPPIFAISGFSASVVCLIIFAICSCAVSREAANMMFIGVAIWLT